MIIVSFVPLLDVLIMLAKEQLGFFDCLKSSSTEESSSNIYLSKDEPSGFQTLKKR